MNRLLLVLLVVVAGVLGLGLYQKWFQVASDSDGGKGHITVTVDKDKIRADEKAAVQKVQDVGRRAVGGGAAPAEKTKEEAAPTAANPK
jgi:hypothetical protein